MKRSATWNRLLSVFLVLAMLLSLAAPAMAAENDGISFTEVDSSNIKNPLNNREVAELREEEVPYADEDVVRVSIFLKKAATIEAGYAVADIAANSAAMAYRAGLKEDQNALVQKIEKATGEKLDVAWNLTLAANLISANVKYGQIEVIEAVKGVEKVVIETEYSPDVASKSEAEPNMATSGKQTGSYLAWEAGYTGAGSKVAIVDTGLDVLHEAFDPEAFEYSLSLLDGEYDLMTSEDVAAVLSELHIAGFGVTADDLYVNSKVPFGFSYIDEDLDLSHENSSVSEHGSHVAGISAANAYVARDGEFVDALTETFTKGVAPDAQIMVMKVFGNNGGAYDSDYMAAIEDAIILGADSVNLSLGSGSPGYTRNEDYQDILDGLSESGVVVVISAGNSGAWYDGTWTNKNQNGVPNLYADDVSTHTGGSPGTYTNSLGVASVNNTGTVGGSIIVADEAIAYMEDFDYANNKPLAMWGMEGPTEYEYVFIPGFGTPEDWAVVGDELEGKFAVCSRGETSFFEKANAAVEAGALGVIIYNNVPGVNGMVLTGYEYEQPVVMITQDAGMRMWGYAEPREDGAYFVGTLEINGRPGAADYYDSCYTMSPFSSWGVPGSLTIKPEITAPGGDILSVGGYVPGWIQDHETYEMMSGTSMAAPQVAGMVAVMTQYFRESGLVEKTGKDARVLAQSLLMSTAEPMMSGANYYYYPVLQQGAGLANVANAVMADSYILMGKDATASYADGKVKAELGDDPDRTGVYTFSFAINNITEEAKRFSLSADVFTQNLFMQGNTLYMDTATTPLNPIVTWKVNGQDYAENEAVEGLDFDGDGMVTEFDGQIILEYVVGNLDSIENKELADLNDDGEITTYDAYLFFDMWEEGKVEVPANGSAEVEVTITLSESDKQWLSNYPSGAYIEAYVYAESMATEEGLAGTCHSIPVLGFYGGWTEASMFDKGSHIEYNYGLETRAPYLYQSNLAKGFANRLTMAYADDSDLYIFGGNPAIADEIYMPERNALSGINGDMIYGLDFAQIRNAGQSVFFVKNTADGSYLAQQELGAVTGAYYSPNAGAWQVTNNGLTIGFTARNIPDNTALELGLTLIPEYYIDSDGNYDLSELGDGATFSMPFVVDNTAPTIAQNGINLSSDKTTLTVTASDNQYVAAVAMFDELGSIVWASTGSHAEAEPGEVLDYVLDVSEAAGSVFLIQVIDYAYNVSTYEVEMELGEMVERVDSVTLSERSLVMKVDSTKTLTANVSPANASDRTVTWKSSNEAVAKVDANGVVTAVAEGDATITATSNLDPTKSASCSVEVIDISVDMNALVWDEEGSIWYSEFNTADLPDYEKLSGDLVEEDYLVAATVGPNGTIYASSLNTSNGEGALYTIDPDTYAVTKLSDCIVQGLHIFYSDLTYAPAMFGTGVLLGTYGPYVIAIDATTGEAIDIIDQYDSDLVGIATCYGEYDASYGEYQDVVYVIQNDGTVIQEIYYGYDGMVVPMMYYFYGFRASMDSGIDVGDAWYYNSAYYDGTYLYWSAFNLDTDDEVTLYAIDADYTGNAYELGKFAEGVWPVGGLHQKESAPYLTASAEGMEEIRAMVAEKGMPETAELQLVKRDMAIKAEAKGGLNSVSVYQAPAQTQDAEEEFVNVKITAKDADGIEVESTNGLITITYDPELQFGFYPIPKYMALSIPEPGKVVIAYVQTSGFDAGEAVLELLFENPAEGSEISLLHDHYNDKASGYEETIKLNEKEAETPVQWHSVSTTLSGNIGLNFYAKLSKSMLKDEDAFIRFTFADKVVEVPVSDAVAAERDGETVYRFTCPVTSKNMTDVVTAQFMNADGAVGKAVSESVQSYCDYMIENYDDAKLVALMKAMLNYGASAQVLFNYKTDALANANLSAADKALAEVDASAHAYVKTGSEDGIKLNMATLLLDSETTVRVYYELTGDKTIDQYTFTIDGEKVTPTKKGDLYYIEVKGVGAHNLDEMYTFTVGGLSIEFSALSYVNMVLEDPEGSTEAMMNNAKALFAYSTAAESYIK